VSLDPSGEIVVVERVSADGQEYKKPEKTVCGITQENFVTYGL